MFQTLVLIRKWKSSSFDGCQTLVLVRKWKSSSFNVCQTLVLVPQSACICKLALFQQTFAHYINKMYKIIVGIIYIGPHSCYCVDCLCSSMNNQKENVEFVSLLFLYTCMWNNLWVCNDQCWASQSAVAKSTLQFPRPLSGVASFSLCKMITSMELHPFMSLRTLWPWPNARL